MSIMLSAWPAFCKGIQRQIAELSLQRDSGTEPEWTSCWKHSLFACHWKRHHAYNIIVTDHEEGISSFFNITFVRSHVINALALEDLNATQKMWFSILFYWLVSSALLMIMPFDECHKTLLMISQPWFRANYIPTVGNHTICIPVRQLHTYKYTVLPVFLLFERFLRIVVKARSRYFCLCWIWIRFTAL